MLTKAPIDTYRTVQLSVKRFAQELSSPHDPQEKTRRPYTKGHIERTSAYINPPETR